MVKKKRIPVKEEGAEQRILAAARKVFTTRGMAGARMQDIADEAGMNKALLHYYFRDKQKLFETVFLEQARKFFPRIGMIISSELPLFEKIETFVHEYIDEIQASPYLPWFVLNEMNRDPDAFVQQIMGAENLPQPARFLEQVEKGVRSGQLKKISPHNLLLNMLSMTIFPFIAKPMLLQTLRLSPARFGHLMEERKKEIPRFIIDAIRK